jgi:hypothetical protein
MRKNIDRKVAKTIKKSGSTLKCNRGASPIPNNLKNNKINQL